MKKLLHILLVFQLAYGIINAQNPSMVFDINTYAFESSSNPTDFFMLNNKLCFKATDERLVAEYWAYDGINDPEILENFIPYLDNMLPRYMTEFNNKFYFYTYKEIDTADWLPSYYDIRIWEYDVSSYPKLLKSYNGSPVIFPSELIIFNNKLYFNAFDTISGIKLWVYDGTNSPVSLSDENKEFGFSPRFLTIFNNKLYYSANSSDGLVELWVYDGINDPGLIYDFMGNPVFYPSELKVFNGKLYFCAHDPMHGSELWVYDGINNPILEKDIYPGSYYNTEGKSRSNSSSPSQLTVFNNKLYFCANDGIHGKELMEYDGINNPSLVKDILPGKNSSSPSGFTELNNKLYFVANDELHGYELWEYDGINDPVMVSDIQTGSTGSHPLYLMVFSNKLYFSANDGANGRELWEYDGIDDPAMLKDICIRSNSSSPSEFKIFDDKLYFQANDGQHGEELWEYNGSNEPVMIKDISPNNYGYGPRNLCVFENKLYFTADNGTNGDELWKFDGTGEPALVKDICEGSCSSSPLYLTVFSDKLYFMARYNIYDYALWAYDSISDLKLVSDILKGYNGFSLSEFPVFHNKLIFVADDGWHGLEMWEYDSITNPILVKDINQGTYSSYPSCFTILNDKLYFTAVTDSLENSKTLLEYDGINEPSMVFPTWGGNDISNLCVFNNKLYFSASDKTYGNELWKYDGTGIPVLVKDIYPGYYSYDGFKKFAYCSNPSDLAVFNNKMYFSADEGIHGAELWKYDGINDPVLVKDILPGSSGSCPAGFTVFNNRLYFSANDAEHGRELWVFEPAENISLDARNDFGASLIVYPNPFSVSTIISYELPGACEVRLEILNMLGKKITTLVNEPQNPGIHEVEWNAAGVKPGIYFCKLKTDNFEKVIKLVISR
jgi:ELWxxDGT repeat protein